MSKLNYEQIQEELGALKAKRKEVNNAIGAIRLKHKIAKGEKPKDKKLLSEWNTLHTQKSELTTKIEGLEAKASELKPKTVRATKYEYPADCTTPEQKKAFRTKMRAKASAAEKPAKAEKKAKKAEKSKSVEKPEKTEKAEKSKKSESSKKDKSGKKDKKKSGPKD